MKINRKWSSEPARNIDNNANPWAGLASYEDPETTERKLRFCGRDDESYDVAKLIMGNIFVTLYGKSGIGKTSLLNAGVFPELREEQFTPISIRLGVRDGQEKKTFQEIIIEEIERKVCRRSVINVVEKQSNMMADDFLWNYFARHRFYDSNNEPTSPVIVFDQFEEVFRYKKREYETSNNSVEGTSSKSEAETLLRQIDYINDKDHAIDNCIIDGQSYRYETNFRFVVSIREDDLYRLEDCLDNNYLPALKRCRYRLHSLSPQNASDAILIPGESFFPESEQERNEIVEKIIAYVSDKEGKNISTNILSLICSQLYQSIVTQNIQTVSASNLESFFHDNPIEKFYLKAISKLSRKEKKYIETKLIDSAGRRNSISYNDFDTYIKHKEIINSPLAILHELNVSSGDEGARVELIHDKLAEVISKRKKNEESKLKYVLSFLIAMIILAASIILFLVLQNRKKEYIIEFREDESISLTDYWKANICILDKQDTIMVDTFDKSTTKVPFLYGKSGSLECHVTFMVGDIADIKKELLLKI